MVDGISKKASGSVDKGERCSKESLPEVLTRCGRGVNTKSSENVEHSPGSKITATTSELAKYVGAKSSYTGMACETHDVPSPIS